MTATMGGGLAEALVCGASAAWLVPAEPESWFEPTTFAHGLSFCCDVDAAEGRAGGTAGPVLLSASGALETGAVEER